MKSKKMVFFWVDDDKSREKFKLPISRHKVKGIPTAEVYFINVRGKDCIKEIKKEIAHHKPNLVIIDHFLNNASQITNGTTLAEYFREQQSAPIPIIGVTGARKFQDIYSNKRNIYEDIYEVEDLKQYFDSFFIFAADFKKLSRRRFQNKKQIIKLLNPPNTDTGSLERLIPDELISIRFSSVSDIFKWVWRILLENPGILYDKLWVSTLLGIKEDSFIKVEKFFVKAEYKGIFSVSNKQRWWGSKIREILYKNIPKKVLQASNMPWELGRKLPGIRKHDYSECNSCHKGFPEIVGYTDETHKKRIPLHLACSVASPKGETKLPYFEEIRIAI